ncbi:hypothetical protein cypCar_00023353 [Cyprinus carpio]|nr:hypothetical protein cypCar_00023353 [Cyprinus carpio]
MASLYKEPNWSTKLETVKDKIIERIRGPEVSLTDPMAKLKKYYYGKDLFSLTDVWAVMVVMSYVKEIDEHTLTEQRKQHNKDPFPIYAVIDKQSKQSNDGDPWFEINPYEAGYSLSGVFVDTGDFGSQFHKGSKIKHQDEFDMLYLQDFPDHSLCAFYYASLSERCKARLPGNGPKEDFATFMEWVRENNGSQFTVCPPEEDISSPTPEPETSQLSSRCAEQVLQPTTEPKPDMITEPIIAPELGLESATDQVCELATPCIVGVLVEIEGLEGGPAHNPAAEAQSPVFPQPLSSPKRQFSAHLRWVPAPVLATLVSCIWEHF